MRIVVNPELVRKADRDEESVRPRLAFYPDNGAGNASVDPNKVMEGRRFKATFVNGRLVLEDGP